MNKVTLKDIDPRDMTVLLRADFNLPIEAEGLQAIAAYDRRIRITLPTINYLLLRNCKVIICSHLGRPKGEIVEALRMGPIAEHLSTLLGRHVRALRDCVGSEVEEEISQMSSGDVALLENLRFKPGEEGNDPEFAKALSRLGELFVLDAFGAVHRPHASIVGVPSYLPTAAGLLLEQEVDIIDGALQSPKRPLVAVLGGAKVSDKIKLLQHLLVSVDALLIGGGMVGTFLKFQGKSIGDSLVEDGLMESIDQLMNEASSRGVLLHLPDDVVVASDISAAPSKVATVDVNCIPDGFSIVDIGPRTVGRFFDQLSSCKTVIWNGPLGIFEYDTFAKGTIEVANILASLDAVTVIGGGSTGEAVESLGLSDRMSHVSSGGGAMLEFLEGKELPGIAALPAKAAPRLHSME